MDLILEEAAKRAVSKDAPEGERQSGHCVGLLWSAGSGRGPQERE
jgi:hypothetical protein